MAKKILIVEDHDSLRRLMGLILSKDFSVYGAKNGLEAMGWLSRGEIPDLIITDAHMPELDGYELLDNLRCSGMFCDIPVIVVSDDHNPELEQHFRKLGVSAFLRKPFKPAQLQEQLLHILQEKPFVYA